MTQYHVDAAEVSEAAARASASGAAIRTEVQAMVGHLQRLESTWRGGAAVAFGTLLADWRSAQAQVEQALEAIGTALGAAARGYADAEDQAARMFRR
jgi:WXG100 family type VII secretion target